MNKTELLEKTKTALIYTYAHLPEELMFLANPPLDVTKDKYNDKKYLTRVSELIEELNDISFTDRSDGTTPYSKEIILKHIKNRLEVI